MAIRPAKTRQLHVSALQARVFNAVVSRRLAEAPDALGRIEVGDLAWLHPNRAAFAGGPDADELATTRERARAFEVSPSGPIPGRKTTRAAGVPGRIEDEELARLGLGLDDFGRIGLGVDQKGARRPLRVPVGEPRIDEGERQVACGSRLEEHPHTRGVRLDSRGAGFVDLGQDEIHDLVAGRAWEADVERRICPHRTVSRRGP